MIEENKLIVNAPGLWLTSDELHRHVDPFVANLNEGRWRIEYERFGDKVVQLQLAKELEANIHSHWHDDYCYSSEENHMPRHLVWLYHFRLKAIWYGALQETEISREQSEGRLSQIHEELAEITKQLRQPPYALTDEQHEVMPEKLEAIAEKFHQLAEEVKELVQYKADLKHLHRTNEDSARTTSE